MPIPETGDVHVWLARSSTPDVSLPALDQVLDSAEKTAAARFIFDRHRVSYIFAHGVLRQVLGSYLECPPEQVRFGQNAFGKPHISSAGAGADIRFNMSHSGDAVLIGVTSGRHIGVDIELMRQVRDLAAIAKSNFTEAERAFIYSYPPDLQQKAFFTCWARKEAFIKAVGKGLSIAVNTFDSSIPSGQPGTRIVAPKEAPDVESWWIADLTVPTEYAGAIAIEEGFKRLTYHTWTPALY